MDARRLRLGTILAVAAVAGLTLLAGTQPWWFIEIAGAIVEVPGTVASPALPALALAGLALAAALAIAGVVFRVVLGVLQLLVGATVVLASFTSLASPVAASASLLTDATGVAGGGSREALKALEALVEGIDTTAWPTLAVVAGVLSILLGIVLLLTVGRWPRPSRRYQAIRLETADGDPVADWDALSDGTDPTSR